MLSLKYMTPKKISALGPILALARTYMVDLHKKKNMFEEKNKLNV